METHNPEEEPMKKGYKNFQPNEFAEFVKNKTGLNKIEKLGNMEEGRTLFKISK